MQAHADSPSEALLSDVAYATVVTPCGPLVLQAQGGALVAASYTQAAPATSVQTSPSAATLQVLHTAQAWLSAYLQRATLPTLPSISAAGTPFQQRVWTELQHIPIGHTLSYAQLTARLGDMNAIRAVAAANGANPLAIFIPCHRVIGSDGSLTGYAGGLHRKQWLLQHEGALPRQLF